MAVERQSRPAGEQVEQCLRASPIPLSVASIIALCPAPAPRRTTVHAALAALAVRGAARKVSRGVWVENHPA